MKRTQANCTAVEANQRVHVSCTDA